MHVVENFRIRAAEPSDLGFVRDLGHQAFSEFSPNAAREVVAMASRGQTFIAEERSLRVGFVVVDLPREGVSHISALAVQRSARGRGVGQRLLAWAEQAGRADGARELALVTADGNLAALDLFLRSGFRRTKNAARYYARGQSGLWLSKSLR
jgi:ribosomal protein S18 acetylase RimI-like enzyme